MQEFGQQTGCVLAARVRVISYVEIRAAGSCKDGARYAFAPARTEPVEEWRGVREWVEEWPGLAGVRE